MPTMFDSGHVLILILILIPKEYNMDMYMFLDSYFSKKKLVIAESIPILESEICITDTSN